MEDELLQIAIQGASAEAAALLASRLGHDISIVMMVSIDGKGGVYTHGYDNPQELMGNTLEHVQAMFEAHGLNFRVAGIGQQNNG